MKVHVIGGGPAGLYFAILMKKAWPQTRITVFERNRPDDTFGFGVVFSDETLDTFEAHDRESYRAITGHFAYWDDIEINFRGTVAPHRRQRVLRLLAHDAAQGARPARARARRRDRSTAEADPRRSTIRDSDLVVAADGINSRIREASRTSFQPRLDLRPN